jgi:hypothetical protein
MKLQSIEFLGIRGLPDGEHDFTDPRTGAPHDVVVVTGPAASGKTRFLEAVVAAKEIIGPYGAQGSVAGWIEAGGVAKIRLAFRLDDEEVAYAGATGPIVTAEAVFEPRSVASWASEGLAAVLSRYAHDGKGKLEYFPASRRVPAHARAGLGVTEQRELRAGKAPHKYGFVVPFLLALPERPEAAAAFAERLAALSDTCRYQPGDPDRARCLSSRSGPPVPPHELSDGEADAVLFAATAVAVGLDRSLVLVDRPEIHAGERLLAGLRALGRDNQLLLASSSSPELLAAAQPAHIVRLPEGP